MPESLIPARGCCFRPDLIPAKGAIDEWRSGGEHTRPACFRRRPADGLSGLIAKSEQQPPARRPVATRGTRVLPGNGSLEADWD